jgi:peptidoglycan/LPS O-acetylase OafA/YrhL
LLIAAVAFAFTPYFGLFFVGSAFGLLLRDGWFARARASVWWNIAAITAIAGTFVLEWWRQSVAPPPADTLVGYVAGLYRDHFFNITAPVLTFACFCSYPITWLLSRPISRYFGRVSFSLFLLQFTVLSSLLSALIVHYRDKLGVEGCLAIVFVSLLATFALAEVFTRLEHVALRLVDRVVRAVTGPDATSPPRLK